jgi:hypothetical protein
MDKRKLIEKEAEKTLQSLDGISRAEAGPFLFTKIAGRLGEQSRVEKKFNFKLALGVLIIFTLVNLGSYIYVQKDSFISDYTREYQIYSFTSEYFSINNFYFY